LGTRHELGLSWVVPALGELKKELPHRWKSIVPLPQAV
jgi:hypothetical protein